MASSTVCALRSTFEFYAQWCSKVRGHTCTRLHEEVGKRRRRGQRTAWSPAGRSQRGVPTEDDLQLCAVQLAPVRQSHDALLVPIQSRRGHVLSRKKTHAPRVRGRNLFRWHFISGTYRLSFWEVVVRGAVGGNVNWSGDGLITILFLSQRSFSKASNSCSSI